MSVGIYRNRLNREMRRFSNFSKEINSRYPIDIIFEDRRRTSIQKILRYDTMIFISHGSENEIYHKFDKRQGMHQILIDKDHLNLLNGKKVIAISCGTARELGPIACDNGCLVYLGFKNKIHTNRNDGKIASERYKSFITNCYKNAFKFVLEQAIEHSWTFEKTKLIMSLKLEEVVMSEAQKIQREYPAYYEKHGLERAIFAVCDVANNTLIFGDANQFVS